MKKTLKVGIIGTGGIARGAHLNPGWLAVPDAEISKFPRSSPILTSCSS